MKKNDIVVKKSKIHNRGVFANRNFKKGGVVLKWNPKVLKESEIKKLLPEEKHYLYKYKNDEYFLMQIPEKYVNHSCDANTKVKNKFDVAIRDIKKGEEITSNYGKEASFIGFKCRCGSEKCRSIIK